MADVIAITVQLSDLITSEVAINPGGGACPTITEIDGGDQDGVFSTINGLLDAGGV